ncbi:C40 family peptidase, partial [Streptomyces sp. B1866]|uniref:C40 family peptidase n=1 Tax=Streptomyces sp. B1866 TaxID=3075431 RepID=UPI00288C7B69
RAAPRQAQQAGQQTRQPAAAALAAPAPRTAAVSAPEAPGPATGSAATVVAFLRAQIGKAYVLGAAGPSAYDCSGLTLAAFRQVGVSLPRVSQSQSTVGRQVSLGALQPGDILYWGGAGSAYHVAVYVGGGKYVGAQNSRTGVVERSLSYDMPTGAVRVL